MTCTKGSEQCADSVKALHNGCWPCLIKFSKLDQRTKDGFRHPPIIVAAVRGNVNVVKYLLKNHWMDTNVVGHNVLHAAIFAGKKDVVEAILKYCQENPSGGGEMLAMKDRKGKTPLDYLREKTEWSDLLDLIRSMPCSHAFDI